MLSTLFSVHKYDMRNLITIVEQLSQPTVEFMTGQDTAREVMYDKTGITDRIKYLDGPEARHENHLVIRDGDKIVSMGGVQVNPYDPEQLWIKFISTDPEYQGRGYARMILRAIYEYCAKNGYKMAPGGFTEQGERLRRFHDLWDKEFPSVAYKRDRAGRYINDYGKIVRDSD